MEAKTFRDIFLNEDESFSRSDISSANSNPSWIANPKKTDGKKLVRTYTFPQRKRTKKSNNKIAIETTHNKINRSDYY